MARKPLNMHRVYEQVCKVCMMQEAKEVLTDRSPLPHVCSLHMFVGVGSCRFSCVSVIQLCVLRMHLACVYIHACHCADICICICICIRIRICICVCIQAPCFAACGWLSTIHGHALTTMFNPPLSSPTPQLTNTRDKRSKQWTTLTSWAVAQEFGHDKLVVQRLKSARFVC